MALGLPLALPYAAAIYGAAGLVALAIVVVALWCCCCRRPRPPSTLPKDASSEEMVSADVDVQAHALAKLSGGSISSGLGAGPALPLANSVDPHAVIRMIVDDLETNTHIVGDATNSEPQRHMSATWREEAPAGLSTILSHRKNPLYCSSRSRHTNAADDDSVAGDALSGDSNLQTPAMRDGSVSPSQSSRVYDNPGAADAVSDADPNVNIAEPHVATDSHYDRADQICIEDPYNVSGTEARVITDSHYDQADEIGVDGPYYSHVAEVSGEGPYYNNIGDPGRDAATPALQSDGILPPEQDLARFEDLAKMIKPQLDAGTISFHGMLPAGAFGMIAKGRVLLPTGEDIFANITMLPLDDPRKGAAALAMAYTLHALVHPRIHRVVGVAVSLERTLLLTEFTLEASLHDYIKAHSDDMELEDRAIFARDMADALSFVTSRGFVHGDVRAANVLLVNGVARLSDFGRRRTVSPEYNATGLRWLAPELDMASARTATGDIFSFGIFLMELFEAGELPYEDQPWSHTQVFEQVKAGYRMGCPISMPRDMYQMSLDCWAAMPTLRPSFATLVDRLTLAGHIEPMSRAPATGSNAQTPALDFLPLPPSLLPNGSRVSVLSSQSHDEWAHIARTGRLAGSDDASSVAATEEDCSEGSSMYASSCRVSRTGSHRSGLLRTGSVVELPAHAAKATVAEGGHQTRPSIGDRVADVVSVASVPGPTQQMGYVDMADANQPVPPAERASSRRSSEPAVECLGQRSSSRRVSETSIEAMAFSSRPASTHGRRLSRRASGRAPIIATEGLADTEYEQATGTMLLEAHLEGDEDPEGVELVQMPKAVAVQSHIYEESLEGPYEPNFATETPPPAVPATPRPSGAQTRRSDSSIPPLVPTDADCILMAPAALRLENRLQMNPAPDTPKSERRDCYDDVKLLGSADVAHAPTAPKRGSFMARVARGRAPSRDYAGAAPVLYAMDEEEDAPDSNYMTPRALLEPEWLHGVLSRQEAEAMVCDQEQGGGVPGAFLFRRKQEADEFAITVMTDWDTVEHFLLQYETKLGWYLNGDMSLSCGAPDQNMLLVVANLIDAASPWALPLNVPVSCIQRR